MSKATVDLLEAPVALLTDFVQALRKFGDVVVPRLRCFSGTIWNAVQRER